MLASQWIQQMNIALSDVPDYPLDIVPLTFVRLCLAQDTEFDAIQVFLTKVAHTVKERGHTLRMIECGLLQARLYLKLDKLGLAENTLEQTLFLAEPAGLIDIFLSEGEAIVGLLVRLGRKEGPLRPYIHHLLALLAESPDIEGDACSDRESSMISYQLVEPLSPRELEVLQLIGDGQSNAEIAEELVITVGTVKKHINHIFGKLAVRNRVQAIKRARELTLLK